MGAFIDMTGQKHGRLTVLGQAGRNKHRQLLWRCSCECGNETVTEGFLIRYGQTQSCGCLHVEATKYINHKHGMSGAAIYRIWRGMMQRCHDRNSHAYDRYGGRGIKVCDRWREFENFYADMGDKPRGMSLDRIDNDGNYEPGNVEWRTAKEQARNRRSSVFVERDGKQVLLADLVDEYGLRYGTVWRRIKQLGWSVDRALQGPRTQEAA